MNRKTLSFRQFARVAILAAVAAGTAVAPALAADWHHERDWRGHDARHHVVAYAAPVVVPQVIVADPAPIYVPAPLPAIVAAPAATLSINIPLVFH